MGYQVSLGDHASRLFIRLPRYLTEKSRRQLPSTYLYEIPLTATKVPALPCLRRLLTLHYSLLTQSGRFAGHLRKLTYLHIFCGVFIIYCGCYLQIDNMIGRVSTVDDQEQYRQILYYMLRCFAVSHSITILAVLPKVMGEKRITLPLYFGAGVVNFINAITLLCDPNLKNAFLVWGSVNTFIYVRAILLLRPANMDWELMYTYAIVSAASISYPLSMQHEYVYSLSIGPLVYAPFHEKFVESLHMFGWTREDNVGGNMPSNKNIAPHTVKLRTALIGKNYAKELEKSPNAQLAANKIQDVFRRLSIKRQPSMARQGLTEEYRDTANRTCRRVLVWLGFCCQRFQRAPEPDPHLFG